MRPAPWLPVHRQPTIVIASRGDPATLATRGFAANVGTFGFTSVFNATLSFKDEYEAANPYLAESLPQLNTASWTVAPDGRMATSWKLRPNLTWHDGQPLTADDFAFAYSVYTKPELGASQTVPIKQIEGIDAPDPTTVVIRWKQLYADAVVENGGFFPPASAHPGGLVRHPGPVGLRDELVLDLELCWRGSLQADRIRPGRPPRCSGL